MEEKISLKDHETKWRILVNRQTTFQQNFREQMTNDSQQNTEDPFDCSSIVIPPLYVQAEQVVADSIQKWEQLEERKVVSGERNPTWYRNHVRLPDHFDYTTQGDPPVDNNDGDRVVSLEDPTEHLSYERALWDLFASVPTASDLLSRQVHELKRTNEVLEEISQGFKDYSRIDGHSLSRLRMKDRHGLPPSDSPHQVPTIVFECWRRLPGRFGAIEPHRMVLEFLGTQTLLDLHRSIIELTDDRLWNRSRSAQEDTIDSGFFFMEGIFYSVGTVDYVTPIRSWLSCNEKSASRLKYLGLKGVSLSSRPMQGIALQDLEMRLGVRYVHVHHGDVECSIYLIDRKISPKQVTYPLIHDIWTPPFATSVDCEACRTRTATVVTSTLCEEGHRLLCKPCCRQLCVPEEHVEEFMVWKGQSDLSAGAKLD